MSAPAINTERQRELIEQLTRLIALRAKEEVEIRQRQVAREAASQQQYEADRARLTADFEREHAALIVAYQARREVIFFEYESHGANLVQEEEQFREQWTERHAEALEDAKSEWQLQVKQIEAAYTNKNAAMGTELTQFRQQCEAVETDAKGLAAEAQSLIKRRGFAWPADPPQPPPPADKVAHRQRLVRATEALEHARQHVKALAHQPADKFLRDGWPVLIFLFAIPVVAPLCWWLLSAQGWPWILAGSLLIPLIIAVVVRQVVRPMARRQVLSIVPPFQAATARAQTEATAALQAANLFALQKKQRRAQRRDKALAEAKAAWMAANDLETTQLHARLNETAGDLRQRRAALEDDYEARLDAIEASCPPQIAGLEDNFEWQMAAVSDKYRAALVASRQQAEREWNDLVTKWSSGLVALEAAVKQMTEYCDALFPPWDQVAAATAAASAEGGQAPQDNIAALRFGRYRLNLETCAGGPPRAEGLAQPPPALELPAVLSYPGNPSLLLEAEGEGRDEANRTLQDVMLRLLTTFPPGKVRFTIIDPIGLGQNFSVFMHLADYDPRLVNNRIWTESAHINQRLADLTEHMEDVIQKYLRNDFASIQEYNQEAGEVAEPYQILVVANFPANFSDDAARRLVSIANSGARCGVYTLVSTDNRLKLPRNFELQELEANAATLTWDSTHGRFAWKHEDLRPLPLSLESPPDDDQFTEIVRAVGQRAKDSARVEVPFESILPRDGAWWSGDSRSEIEAPLGRAGAMKLQYMRLGRGTSQHVLIAGKTGSGKSTLLNALITSLAAQYSPDELHFYLIDFKKGVEFKAYAAHRLPHARVIAIESEREFGLSVLERLDGELKHRGDLFRQAGVQDVKGYRNAHPDAVMPRVLLIIDEFQEFFTSDDKIAHESGLLLDRLVRQGRAFGIHVLLGSQTLAGAYSLARSTIGQMAVRIALQCSESDAHLILSEDNTAARLLSRPGEAIYNDANGLFEGNHPFQVVWLSDFQREAHLQRLAEMTVERNLAVPPPTVFEGNAAANPADNPLLRHALESQVPREMQMSPRAWLGAAVAIKDPTDVVFRRQGGSNVLIVGQQEELALGLLANCLISLAAQYRVALPAGNGAASPNSTTLSRFHVLDGTRPDSPAAGFWRRLPAHLPIDANVVSLRDAGKSIRQIAAEVERRLADSEHPAEPIFVVIDNLARFRDLKKSDDFGISSFDGDGDGDSPSAEKQLTTILREGPALGVHTLVWCDSYNNVNRWLDRQTLRDFDHRVLFQMSAADSSNLMDSAAASRLGPHLALYHSEELGRAEKFRPYGVPTPEWLAYVAARLNQQSVAGAAAEAASGIH